MTQYNMGIIGLGVIGQRMLNNVTGHEDFRVAMAWDPSKAAVDTTRGAHPELHIGETAAQVIEDDLVQIVYVACPPAFHREYAAAVLAAGKAVLCEKPLGIDLAESRELVELAEASNLPHAVNFVHASTAACDEIAKKIRDGSLGDVLRVDVRLQFSQWPRDWQANAGWLAFREQGGFVREVLSHFLYLSERLFGPVTLTSARVHYPDEESAEDFALASFDCSGLQMTVAGATGGTGPDLVEYTVWGSDASYRLYDWYRLRVSDGSAWNDVKIGHQVNPGQDSQARQLAQLADMMQGQPHTLPNFRAALSVQEKIEAILRAV